MLAKSDKSMLSGIINGQSLVPKFFNHLMESTINIHDGLTRRASLSYCKKQKIMVIDDLWEIEPGVKIMQS